MDSGFEKKLKIYNITISILAIGILQWDYFITEDFMMEQVLNLGLSLLLLVNIIRQAIRRIYLIKALSFIVNFPLLIAVLYCLSFLVYLWLFDFMTTATPCNWTLAFIIDLLLGLGLTIEIIREIRQEQQQMRP